MTDSRFENFEKKEHFPTLAEVVSILKKLIKKEFTEVRKREDANGLYLLEVTVPGESEGETTEYAYRRKGNFKECQRLETGIDKMEYFDGIPAGGTSVAEYIDGKWKIC